jgi:hypothetical protein
MKKTLLSLIALGAMAFGADVTGKWTAEVQGRNGQARTTTFTLKQDGGALTGTVSGMGGRENPISEGKVDGDKVSFAVKVEFNGNEMKMLYSGKVEGEELKLKMGREGGDNMRDITAKKAK